MTWYLVKHRDFTVVLLKIIFGSKTEELIDE
jgi:hypothetical protein